MKSKKTPLLLIVFSCFFQCQVVAQKDSIPLWADQLTKSSTTQAALDVNTRIRLQLPQFKNEELVPVVNYFLKVAARKNNPKDIFYDLFYIFQDEARRRNMEKEFNLAVLKMETDPDFAAPDVKKQLYYFYTQFYYQLKEYYHSTKYLDLFLPAGFIAFPTNIQISIQLNALTTLALIDKAKDSLDKAIGEFRKILELSKAKKNAAWEGITSGNLAHTLYLANRVEEALPYYRKDVELSLQNKEWGSAINSNISLGELFIKMKQPDSAFRQFESAANLLSNLSNLANGANATYEEEEEQIYSFFGNYYHQKGDYKKSSDYFTRAFEARDSLAIGNKTNQLQDIIQHIEVDKNLNEVNELQNEIRDKRQYLTIVITIVFAVACILILLLYFFFRLLSKNKTLAAQNETINEQRASLEQVNADYVKLFSIISHDVRGPAVTVHRVLHMLSQQRIKYEDFEKILPNLMSSSTTLNTTIDNLLNWSTSQYNGIKTEPEKVAVKSFIDNLLPLFAEQATAKSIKLQNNCADETILVDKNHFEIIIRNTISNAIKFSHANTAVSVHTRDTGAGIEVSIHDSGVGMTLEQIDAVMNKPGMKTTYGTTGEKGIGLGLKLVKEFVERNGGSLGIESRPNEGSRLSFVLPKA